MSFKDCLSVSLFCLGEMERGLFGGRVRCAVLCCSGTSRGPDPRHASSLRRLIAGIMAILCDLCRGLRTLADEVAVSFAYSTIFLRSSVGRIEIVWRLVILEAALRIGTIFR